MFRIGLTGGIGSGKSTVAGMLRARGARVVDTDAIAHSLTAAGGSAIDALRARFGDAAIDPSGALDRPRMRELAFADPAVRRALEDVLHPLIGAQAEREAALPGDEPCVVFEVPLLVESGRWRERVDAVWVVDCPVKRQIERVLRRAGWTRATVEGVIAQQAPRARRLALADAVIDNGSDDLAALGRRVDALWQRWVEPAAKPGVAARPPPRGDPG